MARIIIDDEQARVVTESNEQVVICDRSGAVLGYVSSVWTPAEIAAARQTLASDQPRHSTIEVLQHLESLTRS